jgi:hypothetical protein
MPVYITKTWSEDDAKAAKFTIGADGADLLG